MARKQGSHADITGPRIRAAAVRLIAQHGCAAVSMRQIAGEVGVQVGALYNYTSDKQSLLCELMQTHMDDLLAHFDKVDLSGAAPEQLEAFTRFHIQFNIPRKDEVFISYMELRNLTPENFIKIEAMRRTYEDRLEGILNQGKASGEFAFAESRITAMALISLLNGVINWYRPEGRFTIDEIAHLYWNLVRNAVGMRDAPQIS
jgi:AcrR family transcriptional regulator